MRKSNQSITPSISLVLKKISDEKALILLNSIAGPDGDKYFQLKEMNLSTKQYYSRISGLMDAGLIKRLKGRYSLTLLGKVVHRSQMIIVKTLSYYWKLKVIESIEMSPNSDLPNEEIAQLIDALIDNHNIKEILMSSISYTRDNHIENNSDNNIDAQV
jgi:predicted transcriptional regulator